MKQPTKIEDIEVNRPFPRVRDEGTAEFRRGDDVPGALAKLEAGEPVLITGFYSNGLDLLRALRTHVQGRFPESTFAGQRAFRAAFQALSNLIWLDIADHQLVVKKSPAIGFLEKLYPEISHFTLSFPQVQGLNSAWQWYQNGISIPVLRNKIHPYYGTYFPTRFDHLILFDNWLKRYRGPKKTAVDIGFGCGVLSLQMVQHGFQKVFATEINPNAVVGLAEYMGDTKLSRKIELDLGHLFGRWTKPTELIVFNPPWLPQMKDAAALDGAIYYPETLFPEFFAAAAQMLLPAGKLVLIFSNLAEITGATSAPPIREELERGGRFQLEDSFTKKVKSASKKTQRNLDRRSDERVELWVLKLKTDA